MKDKHIQYVEFYAVDLEQVKTFYTKVFGWEFTDYGDVYTAFSGAGLDGGFEKVPEAKTGGPLIIIYHSDLASIKAVVTKEGGKISKEIFDFPGGRRFHFIDPGGNQLAVWSDK